MTDGDPGLSWMEIIAGVCGAIIPIAFKANLRPKQVLLMVFIGFSLAVFGAPAAFDYLNVVNQHFRALMTLAIGMVSMTICEAAMRWLEANAYQMVARASTFIPFLRGFDRRKKHKKTKGRGRRASDH